jgi:amidase
VGPDIPPVAEVEPGQDLVVETADYYSGKITRPEQRFSNIADLLRVVPGLDPVSGPIAVAGAEPGDALAIHILDIQVGMVDESAITMLIPDFGGLCSSGTIADYLGPDTKICRVHDNMIDFQVGERKLHVPVHPMIGTIWTAPARETLESFVFDANNCGNIDCPELGPGRTIYLPVSVPGGMLSIGDAHACMGDGEITGMAMETAADVRLRIDLIKSDETRHVACPQIECDRMIGSIGCHFGNSLIENVKEAFRDMIQRLHHFHGFSRLEAYELLGQLARIRTHQTLDDWNSAFVSIDTRYLP